MSNKWNYVSYKNKYIKLKNILKGGWLNDTEKKYLDIFKGEYINYENFSNHYDFKKMTLENVMNSAAGNTLYVINPKDNNDIHFVGKFFPIYNEFWEIYKTNMESIDSQNDRNLYNNLLRNILGKKYPLRKNTENEAYITVICDTISKNDINPCFIRLIDYFKSNFYTKLDFNNYEVILPTSGHSLSQKFIHIITPFYTPNFQNLNPDNKQLFLNNKELCCFSIFHALYISFKLFKFVHGDIETGTNNNMMFRIANLDNIEYIAYEIKKNNSNVYYLFKLTNPNKFPLIILHDYGRSHVNINGKQINAASTVYINKPITESLISNRRSDLRGIGNVFRNIFSININPYYNISINNNEELINITNFESIFGKNNYEYFDTEDKFNQATKDFQNKIKIYKEKDIDYKQISD